MKLEQFQREKDYGATLAIAGGLLKRELITPAEYRKVTAALIRKYHPVICSLKGGITSNPPQKTVP